jgi:hypothetical protein
MKRVTETSREKPRGIRGHVVNRGQPTPQMSPTLRDFIDQVIVPALLERFLREHTRVVVTAPDFQKAEASV